MKSDLHHLMIEAQKAMEPGNLSSATMAGIRLMAEVVQHLVTEHDERTTQPEGFYMDTERGPIPMSQYWAEKGFAVGYPVDGSAPDLSRLPVPYAFWLGKDGHA